MGLDRAVIEQANELQRDIDLLTECERFIPEELPETSMELLRNFSEMSVRLMAVTDTEATTAVRDALWTAMDALGDSLEAQRILLQAKLDALCCDTQQQGG